MYEWNGITSKKTVKWLIKNHQGKLLFLDGSRFVRLQTGGMKDGRYNRRESSTGE
jgi:hypothetical protein